MTSLKILKTSVNVNEVRLAPPARGQLLTTDPMHPVKDPFGRPGLITDPQRRTIKTLYYGNARQVEAQADLNAASDGLLKSRTSNDQMGRGVKVESSEDGSTYSVDSDTA